MYNAVVKTSLWSQTVWVHFPLPHVLAVPWTGYLISLCLGLLI